MYACMYIYNIPPSVNLPAPASSPPPSLRKALHLLQHGFRGAGHAEQLLLGLHVSQDCLQVQRGHLAWQWGFPKGKRGWNLGERGKTNEKPAKNGDFMEFPWS